MSYRFMRVVVMFDLPMETAAEKSEYRRFRQFLIKNGFIMMQKSIYSKLALNRSSSESVKKLLRKNAPKEGLLQILEITEKQFNSTEFLLGSAQSKIVDSVNRIIEI